MNQENEELEYDFKFKALRHRFYKLGKHGTTILVEMGALMIPKGMIRFVLFDIAKTGRLPELETLIEKKEAEILALASEAERKTHEDISNP